MATVQLVSREASEILSRKFSDLTDDIDDDPTERYCTAFSPRAAVRSIFPYSPHPRLLHDDIDVYPSTFSREEYMRYLDEDSYIVSMTPLRAEMMMQMKGTPSRGFRRGGRAELKRLRQKYSTANLKHKFMHLCGASKAMFSSKHAGVAV